jgi:hypothetical protein
LIFFQNTPFEGENINIEKHKIEATIRIIGPVGKIILAHETRSGIANDR